MGNSLIPLYYAIVKSYEGGDELCAQDVVAKLEPDYRGYKLLTIKDVDEALATAKENGLLDESRCDLDDKGELRIFYRINDFGREMIGKYI